MVKIIFRVDSSIQIGSGHLMRCLTLAKKLKKEKNADIYFIVRDLEGNLNNLIKKNNFITLLLRRTLNEENLSGYEKWLTVKQELDAKQTIEIIKGLKSIDLLIIDHYAIDCIWEKMLRKYTKEIMVIDDLANRKHDCDILLDQNFCFNMKERYKNLVPNKCKLFLGPQHAILREEFYEAKKHLKYRDGNIKNILVFFGGIDFTNETMKALKAIILLKRKDITINVVVGKANPHRKDVELFCEGYNNINYFCQVDNMAELMNQADLAIGAGGTTTWERYFLELPSLVIAVADNQIEIAKACNNKFCIFLGKSITVDISKIKKAIEDIEGSKLKQIVLNCNLGKIENKNSKIYLRVVNKKDIRKIFYWSNDPVVRDNSFSTKKITWEEHIKWFNSVIKNKNILFFILVDKNNDIGQIRINLGDKEALISYSISAKYRGLGYGKYILKLAEDEIYRKFDRKYILRALVKKDNIPSQILFSKLNYICEDMGEYKSYYKKINLMQNRGI